MFNVINVTRSMMPELPEYIKEIEGIWDTHWMTNMGVKHRKLQEELKRYLDVQNIELFTNGHMALELAIQAMGVKGEIITTPFTFASTTHAIVRNGAEPVFCDINPVNFTIDVSKIEKLITKKTSAIIPVHVYGNLCDVDGIMQIAKKYGLKVIFDAAHCFGVTYKGKGVGNFGDVSCFSFHATKVFNTIEGGAACFQDKELGDIFYGLKNFGIRDPETVDSIGANAKMNEFCAAMGLCNLRHIDEEIEKRQKVSKRYRENLDGIEGLRMSLPQVDVKENYSYFPVFFDKNKFGIGRNEVYDALMEKGIFARKYFYPLTSAFECYRNKYDVNQTPIALETSRSVLTLPLYGELSLDTVDFICQTILESRK